MLQGRQAGGLEKRDIYRIWHALATRQSDLSAIEYQGWEAEVRFGDLAGERPRLITYRDGVSAVAGRIGLWTCIHRDDILLVYNKVGGKSFLYLYAADRVDELLKMLQAHKRGKALQGFPADEE